MATQFASAARRNFWLGLLFGALFDISIIFAVAVFMNDTVGQAAVVAILVWLGVQAFQLIYATFGLAKGALLFWFERKKRTAAIVDQMAAVKMPKPTHFYGDAEEYLAEVVRSPTANNDAKLFAGATIGSLEAFRLTSRGFLAMTLAMVLEDAIREYGRQYGFVRDDETDVSAEDIVAD